MLNFALRTNVHLLYALLMMFILIKDLYFAIHLVSIQIFYRNTDFVKILIKMTPEGQLQKKYRF